MNQNLINWNEIESFIGLNRVYYFSISMGFIKIRFHCWLNDIIKYFQHLIILTNINKDINNRKLKVISEPLLLLYTFLGNNNNMQLLTVTFIFFFIENL